MIRSACGDELIDVGKILERLEVIRNRAEACVEYAALYPVRVGGVASCLEEVAERPCVVHGVASLVADMDAVAESALGRSRAAVRQHVVAHELALHVDGLVEILLLAGVGIQIEGYF